VELQFDAVLYERDPRKLEVMLYSGLLPRNVSTAYGRILDRISRDQESGLVFKILSWIYHAKEPLCMNELCQALSIYLGDKELHRKYFLDPDSIVEMCKSLITHDQESGAVRFTHSTVKDFLESTVSESLLTVVDLAKILLDAML
jgi:hypothetical protein